MLVKYPRTPHLPWSPGVQNDDRIIDSLDTLESSEVIVTLKMDGENTSLYRHKIHARSLTSSNHISRNWVKNFWSTFAQDIPEGWRVCGENLWAVHSISYSDLPSYFLAFSMWNSCNECLSWDESLEWFALLGLESVPVIYRGPFDKELIHKTFTDNYPLEKNEGYVIGIADTFKYNSFSQCVAKWVRPGHVQTTTHWLHSHSIKTNNIRGRN